MSVIKYRFAVSVTTNPTRSTIWIIFVIPPRFLILNEAVLHGRITRKKEEFETKSLAFGFEPREELITGINALVLTIACDNQTFRKLSVL